MSRTYPRPTAWPSQAISPQRARLEAELLRTRRLIQSAQFDLGSRLCREGFAAAEQAGEFEIAAKFLLNLGADKFLLQQFGAALDAYRRAHAIAVRIGDRNTAAILTANIGSLYSHIGELDAAAEWLETSAAALTGKDRQEHLPRVHGQLAAVRARQGKLEAALALYGQAIDAADRSGDTGLYATLWNRIGEEYLNRNEADRAEGPLLEAYRVRRFSHLPTDSSLFNLARLELARGDAAAAEKLLDRALERAPQQTTLPLWDVYRMRGSLRAKRGRLAEAMADLRIALGLARAWRWSSPADEASRLGSERETMPLQQVYAALIDAGNSLFLATGDRAAMAEAADAAEENRAASLRDLINNPAGYREQLPPAYWETIARLQRAEMSALSRPGGGGADEIGRLRAELVRMEAGLGPGSEAPQAEVIGKTQAALDADTAVLAFQLGRSRSWMWAIDREGAAVYRLPGAAEIAGAVAATGDAVRSGRAEWAQPAGRLHGMLLGELGRRFHGRRRWLIAPDMRLFEAPFAVLVDAASGLTLAELHAIQLIPNLSAVFRRASGGEAVGASFLGLGDAVYNSADPRGSGMNDMLNLPRLVASRSEIESCARAWGRGKARLLDGMEVSRAKLLEELGNGPAIVHIAAHVVESAQAGGYGVIALSPDARGRTEVLTPFEVARWRTPAALVVMSGCSSGAGAALPGGGLLGLTRAWLAAGAGNVVASGWSTPDDAGVLFTAFYNRLSAISDVAEALRQTQNEMIAAGGRRAHPRYWGAYFVVGVPARRKGV
jgi:tetratricopeptide (TPR) repeat protein